MNSESRDDAMGFLLRHFAWILWISWSWCLACFCFLILFTPLSAAPEAHSAKPLSQLFDFGGLTATRGGALQMPVFSSVDGYVVFCLRMQALSPASQKLGVFSLPKHGLAVEGLSLEFAEGPLNSNDWSGILRCLQSLESAVDRHGPLRLTLPDSSLREVDAFKVAGERVFFRQPGTADGGASVLVLAFSTETFRIEFLESLNAVPLAYPVVRVPNHSASPTQTTSLP